MKEMVCESVQETVVATSIIFVLIGVIMPKLSHNLVKCRLEPVVIARLQGFVWTTIVFPGD